MAAAGGSSSGAAERTLEQFTNGIKIEPDEDDDYQLGAVAEPGRHAVRVPGRSSGAAEHGPQTRAMPPAAAAKWQVQFPSGWWDLPPETSAEIEQQHQRGQATAEYLQCRSKNRDEWQRYRIDFESMEQTNTVSGRVREAQCIRTVANVADTAISSMEPGGVWRPAHSTNRGRNKIPASNDTA